MAGSKPPEGEKTARDLDAALASIEYARLVRVAPLVMNRLVGNFAIPKGTEAEEVAEANRLSTVLAAIQKSTPATNKVQVFRDSLAKSLSVHHRRLLGDKTFKEREELIKTMKGRLPEGPFSEVHSASLDAAHETMTKFEKRAEGDREKNERARLLEQAKRAAEQQKMQEAIQRRMGGGQAEGKSYTLPGPKAFEPMKQAKRPNGKHNGGSHRPAK